jgi:hypothetical protein
MRVNADLTGISRRASQEAAAQGARDGRQTRLPWEPRRPGSGHGLAAEPEIHAALVVGRRRVRGPGSGEVSESVLRIVEDGAQARKTTT